MDFNYLRRNSLFSPPRQDVGINPNALNITGDMLDENPAPQASGSQTVNTQPPQQAQPSLSDVYSQMMRAPAGLMNQQYKDFLSQDAPRREDFKPTKMDRLGAILSGVSAGVRGEDGYGTAHKVLDQPFNDATADWKLKADKLAAGAGLEDKDINNRVKTYRDFVTDQYNKGRLDQGQQRIDQQDPLIAAKTNNLYDEANKRETPGQKAARVFGLADKTAANRLSNSKSMFDYTEPTKVRDAIRVAGVRSANALNNQNAKFESLKDYKQYLADNVNPDLYDRVIGKDGFVYAINKHDPTDVTKTVVDAGKMSDADKAALKLKNAKELKQTPGVGTKTTTKKTVEGNTATTETERTPIVDKKPETVHIKLSDNRELDIPKDKLDEAKKRDPKLVVVR